MLVKKIRHWTFETCKEEEGITKPIKISGIIQEIENYNDENWGTLNIKVKPNKDILTDKDGFINISQSSIID